jgi:hypothetical protein
MNNKEICKAAFLVKQSTTAWARMLGQGKLSPASVNKLTAAIPAGTTRQIARGTPGGAILGRGLEGMVVPSFTGGHGMSATKLMYQNLDSFRHYPRPPGAGKVTGVISETLNNTLPVGARAEVMKQHPSVFPKVFNTVKGPQGDIGYTMERLYDIDPAHDGFKKMLQLQNANVANTAYARVARSPTSSTRGMDNNTLRNLYSQLYAIRNTRNSILRESNPNLKAVRRFAGSLKRMSSTPASAVNPLASKSLNFNSPTYGPVSVSDFGFKAMPGNQVNFHNLMRTNDGRFVISDPDISPYMANSIPSQVNTSNLATAAL